MTSKGHCNGELNLIKCPTANPSKNLILQNDALRTKKKNSLRGKLLVFSLALSVITTILWIAAFSTNHWVHWEFPEGGLYRPSKKVYLEKQNSGVWKMCRVERDQNNEKREKQVLLSKSSSLEISPA